MTQKRDEWARARHELFARDDGPPLALSVAGSVALFPYHELFVALGRQREAQCRVLCYGAFPRRDEVRARFDAIRQWL